MPGPGAHTMYAMGVGAGLMRLSRGRFGPHHCVVYAANAFLGPDLGSFAEWLASCISFSSGLGHSLGSLAMDLVHHPFYYPMLLGLPLSYFYAWLSALLLRKGILDPASGVSLSKMQCFLLLSAGSLSHFFLDHLFEENGHSTMYTWILSTGWWKNSAPINPDAVVVVGLLCTSLFVGFVYINSNFQTEKWKIHHQEIRSILETCPDHRDLVLHLVCQSNILAKPSPTSGRGRSRSRGSCFPGSLLLSPTCLVFTVNEPERLHRHSSSTATIVAASAQHSQPGRSHEDFESIKTRTIQDISCFAATV